MWRRPRKGAFLTRTYIGQIFWTKRANQRRPCKDDRLTILVQAPTPLLKTIHKAKPLKRKRLPEATVSVRNSGRALQNSGVLLPRLWLVDKKQDVPVVIATLRAHPVGLAWNVPPFVLRRPRLAAPCQIWRRARGCQRSGPRVLYKLGGRDAGRTDRCRHCIAALFDVWPGPLRRDATGFVAIGIRACIIIAIWIYVCQIRSRRISGRQ